MRTRLETLVESLKRGRNPDRENRVEVPQRRAAAAAPDSQRWKDPVPLMRDREGHMHVLL
ncbi:MAG: hypothetical protein ACJ77M_05525 [Thermoleophilaceae bacterium]